MPFRSSKQLVRSSLLASLIASSMLPMESSGELRLYALQYPQEAGGGSGGSGTVLPETPDLRRCQNAVTELKVQLGEAEDARHSVTSYSPALRAAMLSWEAACLTTTAAPGNFDLDTLTRGLGYLSDGGGAFCTALLYRPGVIVTARHCFSPGGSRETARANQLEKCTPAAPCRNLKFTTFESPSRSASIPKSLRPQTPMTPNFGDRSDFLVVQLDAPITGPTVKLVKPVAGMKLFVGGIFPFGATNSSTAKPQKLYWARPFLDAASACELKLGSLDGCAYHNCQALWSFSGSPLISSSVPGTILFVGFHLGGRKPDGDCFDSGMDSFNRAVVPSAPLFPGDS